MKLRPITNGESVLFSSWEKNTRSYPWSAAQFESAVQSAVKKIMVLDENGQARGFAVLHFQDSSCYIENIMVDPDQQCRGYGRQLLNELAAWAISNQFKELKLEVDRQNKHAWALYEKCGFDSLGERPNAYPAGETAVIMSKKL